MRNCLTGCALAVSASALFMLEACAPIPVADDYKYSTQTKMQAADHWRQFADQAATNTRNAVPGSVPVFVPNKPGVFEAGFQAYLETALMRQGFTLSQTPRGADVIDYSVEPVVHGWRDTIPSPWPFWVIANILSFGEASQFWRDTHAEVIVTVAAMAGGNTLMRTTATFYVPNDDIGQYVQVALGPPVSPAGVRCTIPPLGTTGYVRDADLCAYLHGMIVQ